MFRKESADKGDGGEKGMMEKRECWEKGCLFGKGGREEVRKGEFRKHFTKGISEKGKVTKTLEKRC